MTTHSPLPLPLTIDQIQTLHELARRDAARLRSEAIADAASAVNRAVRRGVLKTLRLCHLPTPEV